MEINNSLSNYALFGLILISVIAGWLMGFTRGFITGFRSGSEVDEEPELHPIVNVYFTGEENKKNFYEMLSGELLVSGDFEDCTKFLSSVRGDNETRVVYSRQPDDKES